MRIAAVIANCYIHFARVVFRSTVDIWDRWLPSLTVKCVQYLTVQVAVFICKEDFFYMFQGSASVKQCSVVRNDE